MEIKNESDKLEFQDMNNADFLTEDHSKYNFGEPESSTIVDQNGDSHDSSFRVESGKVSYDKISEGLYLSSYRKDNGEIEKRELTLEQLSNWFYSPTDKYFNEIIYPIEVKSE